MKPNSVWLSLIILITAFVTYSSSLITSRTDTIWSLYVSASVVKTGNFDLNEYRLLIVPDDYRVELINGHIYSIFPIGTPLMASPFVYILDRYPSAAGLRLSEYLADHRPDEVIFQIEKLVASFLVAVNCVIIFSLARKHLAVAKSIVLTVIFAFATSTWSVASRGLWQHGPSMLCLSFTIYLLVVAKQKPLLVLPAGLFLAFSYLVRPTNIISIFLLTAYVWFAFRYYWGYFVFCIMAVLTPFFVYSYSIYSALLPPYYALQSLGGSPVIVEALAGNLLSPSRGLFVFSPILVFSILGFYRTLQNSQLWLHDLSTYLFTAVVLHWLSISMFRHWYGGWSVGPRFFTDMTPYLIYLLLSVLDTLSFSKQSLPAQQVLTFTFVGLLLFSIFVHYRCSTDKGPESWNATPVDIDKDPRRLWDWSDIQFLRGLCPTGEFQAPKCWYNKAGTADLLAKLSKPIAPNNPCSRCRHGATATLVGRFAAHALRAVK